MRAELKASGKLVISADNETDAYALGKWVGENKIGTNLIIDWAVPLKSYPNTGIAYCPDNIEYPV